MWETAVTCVVCSVYSLARVGAVKVRVDDRESRGVGHGPSRRACGRNRENEERVVQEYIVHNRELLSMSN